MGLFAGDYCREFLEGNGGVECYGEGVGILFFHG